jgi:actin-related protein
MSSDNNSQLRPLILDIGNNFFRIGWAGKDYPDIIAPSVYVNKTDFLFVSDIIDGLEEIFIEDTNGDDLIFGEEALSYSNILKFHQFRKENNYNILVKFFFHYYQQLEINKKNQFKQPIIIITPYFISELEKTKLREIFFNIFKFPDLLFLIDSQGIMAALQKTSAVIVNMGEVNTYITSFLHGFTNIMARDTFPIAGKDLTNYLLNLLLQQRGSGKIEYLDHLMVKDFKDKLSMCILDPEGEIKRIKDGFTKYDNNIDLPDGSKLKINSERFQIVEPLFDPSIIHIDYIGLPEAIAKIIRTWEREDWGELLPNIVLAGGGSLIPGLEIKIAQEISGFFSEKLQSYIKVLAASGRENISWVGASVLWAQGKLVKGWEKNPLYSQEPNPNKDLHTNT